MPSLPCGGIGTTWWLARLAWLPWMHWLALSMEITLAWVAEELAMLFSADWLAMMDG